MNLCALLNLNLCHSNARNSSFLWFCYNPQANVNGATGNVQFDEGGTRKGIEFDIYNLRNNSFQVVSNEDFGYLELSFPEGNTVFPSFSQVFYNA